MPRNPTTKQVRFAAAVAAGKTQLEAYKIAGYGANGKPETTLRNARKVAQDPVVRSFIEEKQVKLLPAPKDMLAIYEHGLATIIELTHEKDAKVRLAASTWLCQEAKEQEEKRKALEASIGRRKAEGDERILAELRGIYKQAAISGVVEAPLVEEVVEATAEQVSGAEAQPVQDSGVEGQGKPNGSS